MEQDLRVARVHNPLLSTYWGSSAEFLLPSTNYYKTYGLTSHEVENKFIDITPNQAPEGLKVFEAQPIDDFYLAMRLTVKRKKLPCMMSMKWVVLC